MPHEDPDFVEELVLHGQGYRLVAGIDEVGRGALAGDVLAGAVILPADADVMQQLHGVRDSKQLSARQREHLSTIIQAEALAIGLGRVPAPEIDRLGIVPATRRAMMLAIANLGLRPDYLLIDAVWLPDVDIPQKAVIKGDVHCLSIAAASVMAKVTRDAIMVELDGRYAGYGFARNKGYGTVEHRLQLRSLGPCAIHRRSYAPVREAAALER
jgi:ribonuclease HII